MFCCLVTDSPPRDLLQSRRHLILLAAIIASIGQVIYPSARKSFSGVILGQVPGRACYGLPDGHDLCWRCSEHECKLFTYLQSYNQGNRPLPRREEILWKLMVFQIPKKNSSILWNRMCGCGNWSVTLREVICLRLFDNRVLRKIFGSKGEEVQESFGKII